MILAAELNHLNFGGLFSLLSLRLILWLPSLFEGTVLLVPFESSVGINNTIFNSEANFKNGRILKMDAF